MPLDNLRPQVVHLDETSRSAHGTVDWLLETEHAAGTHPFSADNELRALVCGQEAFERLCADIESARSSIDIVCWGFDPAMELVRAAGPWPRGPQFGDLLEAAVKRGVQVRLLTWHEPGFAAREQNNLPGYTGDERGGRLISRPSLRPDEDLLLRARGGDGRALHDTTPSVADRRADHGVLWWRRALAAPQGDGARIECRFRRGDAERVRAGVQRERDAPSASAGQFLGLVNEKNLIEEHATHHQKTVLIDYAWEGGHKAVGYVMGLNSLTDYWDDENHEFDSPRREIDWARKSKTAQALHRPVSRDPYRDYACRIAGPALQAVHRNFLSAWLRAGGTPRADDGATLPELIRQTRSHYRAQVVRTQPEEGDQTVKATYFHAPIYARRYLYIENQYFFYEAWASELKKIRTLHVRKAIDNGAPPGPEGVLHLFVVTSKPENAGFLPRTYDMVKSLGEGDSLSGQRDYVRQTADPSNDIVRSALGVDEPEKNLETGELTGMAMKVCIAQLITVNRGAPVQPDAANVRQVYVHSKLMLIDDAYFTLGSANMNLRSMAADSELNIATDDHREAEALRRRVWSGLTNNYPPAGGGDASPDQIALAFKEWKRLMKDNDILRNEPMTRQFFRGFLVPLNELDWADYRVG